MARTYYNYEVDPFNSDAPTEYRRIQTDYYSGSEDDFTAPSSPNFPITTPTRYFLKLPYIIDVSDLTGSRPVLLRDVTNTTNLTPVTGAPGANEFRVAPSTSEARGTIELNAAQASSAIGVDCYVIGGMIHSSDFNNIDVTGNINCEGTVTATTGIDNSSSREIIEYRDTTPTETTMDIKRKVIAIGDWNMDTTASISVGVWPAGTGNVNIRSITAIIRKDISAGSTIAYPLVAEMFDTSGASLGNGGTIAYNENVGSGQVSLSRATGGYFDSAQFDNTSYNRGWIYIEYEE